MWILFFTCWWLLWSHSPLLSHSSHSFWLIGFVWFLFCTEFTKTRSVKPRTLPLNLLSNANRIGQICWQYLGPQWMLGPLWSSLIWACSAALADLRLLNPEIHLSPKQSHTVSQPSARFCETIWLWFWSFISVKHKILQSFYLELYHRQWCKNHPVCFICTW